MGDKEQNEVHSPQYERRLYQKVFHVPENEWAVEATWDEAYYSSAKRLIEGVVRGECLPAYEGVTGLYLFRHYLELALKYVVFHSHWLKDARTNAKDEEIEEVKKTHKLGQLWALAKSECRKRMSTEEWKSLDIQYVDECIKELDAVDPDGERFRYHGEKFGLEKDAQRREQISKSVGNYLWIEFEVLLEMMQHVYDVLNYLDVYMVETHGENEDWEAVLRSF
jgi:hypothetical protein